MKSKLKKRASIIIVLGIFFAISSIYYCNPCLKATSKDKSADYSDYFTLDRENLKISAVSGKIHIDNNWTAAKSAGICTGNGTYSEPYVIKDLIINGSGSGSCIFIENSNVYFKIENCNLYNSGSETTDAGIALYNLGTYLIYKGNLINNIINNCTYGIFLYSSRYNVISENDINNNGGGIAIGPSSDGNEITGNDINNNGGAILVGYSDRTNISGNVITNNDGGIGIYSSDDCDISRNIISKNGDGGIGFTDSYGNGITLNCFDNFINAIDNAGNSFYRNYWADYIGPDADGDGIGDVPYNITGAAGSHDNFPLMKCPISTPQDGEGFPLELVIIISVISGGAVIGVATLLLVRRRRKRME